jgi:hypothetical protein
MPAPRSVSLRGGGYNLVSTRPHLVTTGHSRSKNGVASRAYYPVVYAGVKRIKQRGESQEASAPHRQPWVKPGNDVTEIHPRLRRASAAMLRNFWAISGLPPLGVLFIPGVQKSSGKRAQQASAAASLPRCAWASA